jgi:hypothetical protein
MSDSPEKSGEVQQSPSPRSTDSFDVPVKKSPLFLYAMLQIPILIFMVIMIYILYKTQFS